MARSEGLVARFLHALGGGRKGNSPIFRGGKLGQSPARKSGQSPADENEAKILGWLEDGEEIEYEKKYWRKTVHHEESKELARTPKSAAVGQEPNDGAASGETGMAGVVLAGESATEDHPGSETKTRLRKALLILSDLADVVVGFFKNLRATDWLLLGAVVVLLLVVMMMLFPVTLTWAKTIVNVCRWPWWIWTCISLAVLGYLIWLRSRYE